ncbi:MAG: phage tail assembly chaperone [Pseudomonadota bacterium]
MNPDQPTKAFPWDEMMTFGFGVLKLSSNAFWALSLRELNAALKAHMPGHTDRPSAAALQALMRRFPDISPELTSKD